MIKLRVFAVLAAVFLVVAIALGSIIPADEPSSQVLAGLSFTLLPSLQSFELSHLGVWAWQDLTVPLLIRPIWMVPLALGILCLGAVTSLNWMGHENPPRPRRRRS